MMLFVVTLVAIIAWGAATRPYVRNIVVERDGVLVNPTTEGAVDGFLGRSYVQVGTDVDGNPASIVVAPQINNALKLPAVALAIYLGFGGVWMMRRHRTKKRVERSLRG